MRPLPPRSTLFPYTTLFRSVTAASLFHLVRPHGPIRIKRRESVGNRHGEVLQRREGLRFHLSRAGAGRLRPLLEDRSEEHTSELQSHSDLVCRLLLEKKKTR